MVEDCISGLCWSRNADLADTMRTWPEAFKFVRQMNDEKQLGRNDWRVPNIRELESVTDTTGHSPAIAGKK